MNWRRLQIAILFLLLGAIINVAVAWAFVSWSHGYRTLSNEALLWPVKSPKGFHYSPKYVNGSANLGTTQLGAWVDTDTAYMGRMDIYMAGWPSMSLYAERHYVKDWLGIPGLTIFDNPQGFWDGVALPLWLSGPRHYQCFPTRPLWLGFAINTVFYAAILWLPAFGLGALRRRRRIKRGLCPACAYPIGESSVCTECGRRLKERLRRGS